MSKGTLKVGLALGSGGARGWAHLGVLRALEERGVEVECVAGCSMGALVGAFLAAGRLEVLRKVALQLDWNLLRRIFWEVSLSRSGLTDGRRLLEEMYRLLEVREFRKLELPFRAVATDLNSGEEVVLDSGNLLEAVRASISIPGLFSPVWTGKRLLVDGGLVHPVPVNVARAMGARRVLAVDVAQGIQADSRLLPATERRLRKGTEDAAVAPPRRLSAGGPPRAAVGGGERAMEMLEQFFLQLERKARRQFGADREERPPRPPMLNVLVRSVRIAESRLALLRRAEDPPDLLVEVPVGHIGTLEFQRAEEAERLGYEAAIRTLDAAGRQG